MNAHAEQPTVTIKDFLAPLRRRKKQLAAIFIVLVLATLVLAFGLPPVYRSTGTILIEQQEVPDELVQSTITSYADQQIQVITQLVMTTGNLLGIVDDRNLYPGERRRLGQSEVIERMREDITMELVSADVIDPRSGRSSQATIAFTVAFDHENPSTASKVANDLVTLYLSENRRSRSETAAENVSYFEEASRDAGARVDALEQQLATFKRENEGALPEQYAMNLSLLQRTESELLEAQRQWQSGAEQLAYLNAQLAQIDPGLAGATGGSINSISPNVQLQALQTQLASLTGKYGPDHPDVQRVKREIDAMRREAGVAPDPLALEAELLAARTELASLSERYSPDHPDVARQGRVVASLESDLERARSWTIRAASDTRITLADGVASRINVREGPDTGRDVVGYLYSGETARVLDETDSAWYQVALADGTRGYVSRSLTKAAERSAGAAGASNPAYISLQAQASRTEAEMRSLQTKYDVLQEKLTQVQTRLGQAPEIERQASSILRELALARNEFASHQQNLITAKAGERLEVTEKGEQFTLIEPPIAPLYPRSPNRLAILLLGLILSTAGTVGYGAMAGANDKTYYSPRSVASLVGAPPLAVIPYVYLDAEKHRGRKMVLLVVGSILAAAAVGLAMLHVFWRPLDVLWFVILRKMGV